MRVVLLQPRRQRAHAHGPDGPGGRLAGGQVLLEQVADTIWVCEHKTITPWPKGIQEYKKHLRKQMADGQKKLGMGAGAGVQ